MNKPHHTTLIRILGITWSLLQAAAVGLSVWFVGKLAVVWILMADQDPVHRFLLFVGALAASATLGRSARHGLIPKALRSNISGHYPVATATAALTASIPEDERQATAGHEAAHLVAAVAFGFPVTEIGVRSRRKDIGRFSHRGHILYDTGAQQRTPESVWGSLVTTLAGNAYDRAHGVPGFHSIVDFDDAHRVSGELYRYRAVLPAVGSYTSADDIFDHAFAAATTFITTHAATITTARALLLDQLAAVDADVLTDPAVLGELTDTIAAHLASTPQEALS